MKISISMMCVEVTINPHSRRFKINPTNLLRPTEPMGEKIKLKFFQDRWRCPLPNQYVQYVYRERGGGSVYSGDG